MNPLNSLILIFKRRRLEREVNITEVLKNYKKILFLIPDSHGSAGLSFLWAKLFAEKEKNKKVCLVLPQRLKEITKKARNLFEDLIFYKNLSLLLKNIKELRNRIKNTDIFVDFSPTPSLKFSLETESPLRITWKRGFFPYFNFFIQSEYPFQSIIRFLSPNIKGLKTYIKLPKEAKRKPSKFYGEKFVIWDFAFPSPEGVRVVNAEELKEKPFDMVLRFLQNALFYVGKGDLLDPCLIIGTKILTIRKDFPSFLFLHPSVFGEDSEEKIKNRLRKIFAES